MPLVNLLDVHCEKCETDYQLETRGRHLHQVVCFTVKCECGISTEIALEKDMNHDDA